MEVPVAVPHTRIRHAVPMDLPYLLTVAERFIVHAGCPEMGLDYVPGITLEFMEESIRASDRCVVVAIDTETGVHTGTVAGFLTPWPYGKSLLTQELWWWVEPEYRAAQFEIGKILVEYLQAWGATRGASHLVMVTPGDSSGKDDTLKRLYRRKGFQYCETHFIREV